MTTEKAILVTVVMILAAAYLMTWAFAISTLRRDFVLSHLKTARLVGRKRCSAGESGSTAPANEKLVFEVRFKSGRIRRIEEDAKSRLSRDLLKISGTNCRQRRCA